MAATFWADVSQYQVPVDDRYPHRVLCLRTNSGSKPDTKFDQNYDWALRAIEAGRIDFVILYYFFRPGQANCDLWREKATRDGRIHPRVVAMVDVEGDKGSVAGDCSSEINGEVARLSNWLGDPRRVIGYQNPVADPGLWPRKPAGLKLIIPSYSEVPGKLSGLVQRDHPGDLGRMIAHQYSQSTPCAPFGPCDANFSAMSIPELMNTFGITPESEAEVTAAEDVKFQTTGSATEAQSASGEWKPSKSLAGNSGWRNLAPQPDEKGTRWSVFLNKAVDRQSLIEAIGTLVYEATLRIPAYRKGAKANSPETVLGHAAAAHGAGLDANEKLDAMAADIAAIKSALKK